MAVAKKEVTEARRSSEGAKVVDEKEVIDAPLGSMKREGNTRERTGYAERAAEREATQSRIAHPEFPRPSH